MRLGCRGGDILQELLDQVNVGHHHAPAAVSAETKLIHSIASGMSDKVYIIEES